MKKNEFIEELKYNLEGKLPQVDIDEITSDYADVFDGGMEGGKSEDEISEELGSPAKIARTILEEDGLKKKDGAGTGQTYVREIAAGDQKYAPFRDRLASMGSRLGAYVIDCTLLIVLVIFFVLLFLGFPTIIANFAGHRTGYHMWSAGGMSFAALLLMLLIFSCFNIFSAAFIWATNGYTPGKWLLQIRVVKLSGGRISIGDALLRELIVKSIANGITSGILDLFSFVWGCVSDVNKTVHDVVADTTVIRCRR